MIVIDNIENSKSFDETRLSDSLAVVKAVAVDYQKQPTMQNQSTGFLTLIRSYCLQHVLVWNGEEIAASGSFDTSS